MRTKFRLIHKETGLTAKQYVQKYHTIGDASFYKNDEIVVDETINKDGTPCCIVEVARGSYGHHIRPVYLSIKEWKVEFKR